MSNAKEFKISPDARVWIGDQINPVPTGTYSRLCINDTPGERLKIALKRTDSVVEEYNRRVTNISIELIPPKPSPTDTRKNLDITSPGKWEPHSLFREIHCHDKPFPRIFEHDVLNERLKANKESTIITRQELRAASCAGFFIENCGNKHPFPTEEIDTVISDHLNSKITVQKIGANGETIKATYSLKKITNYGLLPKSNQKVI